MSKLVAKTLTPEQLREHARSGSRIVETWPMWKRTVLTGALRVVGESHGPRPKSVPSRRD